jgi:DNA invertase Pin-like site-specific DNA recombinase
MFDRHDPPQRCAGYIRVSSNGQAESGLSMEQQRHRIERECDYRGWDLVHIYDDPAVSSTRRRRPGLDAAIDALKSGNADVLLVVELDRLVRSLSQFAHLVEQAVEQGWRIVALDPALDLTSEAGEFVANVLVSAARWERRMIKKRIRGAFEAKRRRGEPMGVHTHRTPVITPPDVARRIRRMAVRKMTYRAIAERLTHDRVPTPTGKATWSHSTVQAVLGRTTR